MRKLVGVTFQVEGFHHYEGASKNHGSDVKFLEDSHRHMFGVDAKIEVAHSDRDIEFILLKRQMQNYIAKRWGSPAQFGGMSCEHIATELFNKFKLIMCKVDEDGENYAQVMVDEGDLQSRRAEEKSVEMKRLKSTRVVYILGKIASGKSTATQHYINERASREERYRYRVVEVGQIVRDIKKTCFRTFEENLDKEIVNRIDKEFREAAAKGEDLVVVGIRQLSIWTQLNQNFNGPREIYLCITPTKDRQHRYEKLSSARAKDRTLTFEQAEAGDASLGIDQLITHVLDNETGVVFIKSREIEG